jgi:hypothetical protein
VLAVEASDDSLGLWWKGYTLAEYHERLKSVPDCRIAVVQTQATCCTTTSRRPGR